MTVLRPLGSFPQRVHTYSLQGVVVGLNYLLSYTRVTYKNGGARRQKNNIEAERDRRQRSQRLRYF